ncbi:hypothetical protein L6164_016765 [Bauhinia variegata]|uniref:Uncharacterized protein n=1 Tax=Bauhinia variegata TaxID=167791 RepID=A0ACB9N5I7_BAUVA|nr:hypothetical protein L6164_016765 [Bauhinia variegata]
MTLVEQEMNTNTAPFMARFTKSFSYYGALFDSIESITPRDHPDRVKVEEGLIKTNELGHRRLNPVKPINPGFTVKEGNGGICFGWMGQTLTVASPWR